MVEKISTDKKPSKKEPDALGQETEQTMDLAVDPLGPSPLLVLGSEKLWVPAYPGLTLVPCGEERHWMMSAGEGGDKGGQKGFQEGEEVDGKGSLHSFKGYTVRRTLVHGAQKTFSNALCF